MKKVLAIILTLCLFLSLAACSGVTVDNDKKDEAAPQADEPVDLKPVQNDEGLWGYENSKGELVIDYKYVYADEFSHGIANVSENTFQGFSQINSKGEILDFSPYNITLFFEGLARARKDLEDGSELYGFIDTKGNLVIDFIYDYAEDFEDGRALVSKDGEEFYINTKGEKIED